MSELPAAQAPPSHPGPVDHRRQAQDPRHHAGAGPARHRPDQHPARSPRDPRDDRPGSASDLRRRGRRGHRRGRIVKVHDLKPAAGSTRNRKRVGRGIGGKGGKTAGRGTKGQGARDTIPAGFEGGQLPLHMRIPKLKGFKNPFRVEYQGLNLDVLEASGLDRGHARVPPRARPHPQGRPDQGPGTGRGHPGHPGPGPRVLQVGRGGHRRRGGYGYRSPAAVGRSSSSGQGQPPHQPLVPQAPFRPVAVRSHSGAFEPAQHLQGPRPAQQGPVHAADPGAVPLRRLHPGARHRCHRA